MVIIFKRLYHLVVDKKQSLIIIVKLLLFPITYWQCKFIAIMKLISAYIAELNEKLKSADKQQATIEFYKKIVINPMSGFFMHCLKILLIF
ncbi:MAG: YidC/Oxa1 family membrane protein insertase [Candidatus Walczuchella monophlebidarum]